MAISEAYRRVSGSLPEAFSVMGPWFVVVMTLLPILEAVRWFRTGNRLEGAKSALWALPGLVTLVAGPAWLRFG